MLGYRGDHLVFQELYIAAPCGVRLPEQEHKPSFQCNRELETGVQRRIWQLGDKRRQQGSTKPKDLKQKGREKGEDIINMKDTNSVQGIVKGEKTRWI